MVYAYVTGYFYQENIVLAGNIKDSNEVIMGPADFLSANGKQKTKHYKTIHPEIIRTYRVAFYGLLYS